MSDPIKDLENFPTMPTSHLPAVEVRRRGDRIRRRRQALSTVGGVAAVAVIATAGTVFLGGGDDGAPGPATTDPTTPAAVALGPVGPGNLLTDDDAVYDETSDWSLVDTWPGDGQSPADPCQGTTFSALGATAVQQRSWQIEYTIHLQQAVSSYPGVAEAEAAYDDLAANLETCDQEGVADRRASTDDAPVPATDDAVVVDSTWTAPGSEDAGESYSEHRTITALVRVGDRISLLTHDMPAGDYDWDDTMSPVEEMLADVTFRLMEPAGDETPAANPFELEEPPASALVGQGDVPDLELATGFTDHSGDGGSTEGPTADLPGVDQTLVCGTPLIDQSRTPTGRLLATNSGPEWFELRQVIAYEDEKAATGALAQIVELVNACPEETVQLDEAPPTDRLWQVFGSDDPGSVLFAGTPRDGLGGSLYQVIRVGRSLLVLMQTAEWSTESVAGGVPGILDEADTVRPIVCAAFREDGCLPQ